VKRLRNLVSALALLALAGLVVTTLALCFAELFVGGGL